MVFMTAIHKSLLDVLRPDMNAVCLGVTASGTVQDSNTKLLHSLFNMMQKEIHGIQDQLASFLANIEKLENDLQT